MNKQIKPFQFLVKIDAKEFLREDQQHLADYANYIQHRILHGRTIWALDGHTQTYTCLKAEYLGDVIPKNLVKKVKEALLTASVVETDNYYVQGHKALGYRFPSRYDPLPLKRVSCTSVHITTKLRDLREAKRKGLYKVHRHLLKWLKRVELDLPAAIKMIDAMEMKGTKLPTEQVKLITKEACQIINDKDFEITVCDYGRVHSIITRLLTPIRERLCIQGQQLVTIDVANSQPLILALLIKQSIETAPSTTVSTLTDVRPLQSPTVSNSFLPQTAPCPSPPPPPTSFPSLAPSTPYASSHTTTSCLPPQAPSYNDSAFDPTSSVTHVNKRTSSSRKTNNFTSDEDTNAIIRAEMGVEEDGPTDPHRDVREYIRLCEEGNLYPVLMKGIQWKGTKGEFKGQCWFEFLYGKNLGIREAHSWRPTPLMELFCHDFPTVWDFISQHKKANGTKGPGSLACMMQRAESDLVIGSICGRLMTEHPEVPVVTVHDSIMTLPEYADLVVEVMQEEFKKVGMNPTLCVK